MSNKVYNVLKYLSTIGIPAIVVFLTTVLTVLNCPYTEVIVTIVGAIGVLLGSLIGVSSAKYNKAQAQVTETTETKEGAE